MRCNMTVKPHPDPSGRNGLGDVKYTWSGGAQFHTSHESRLNSCSSECDSCCAAAIDGVSLGDIVVD